MMFLVVAMVCVIVVNRVNDSREFQQAYMNADMGDIYETMTFRYTVETDTDPENMHCLFCWKHQKSERE